MGLLFPQPTFCILVSLPLSVQFMSPRSVLLMIAALLIGSSSAPTADLILMNGTVVTLDETLGDAEPSFGITVTYVPTPRYY